MHVKHGIYSAGILKYRIENGPKASKLFTKSSLQRSVSSKKKKKKKQAIYWKSFAVGVMGAVQPIMAQDQTE